MNLFFDLTRGLLPMPQSAAVGVVRFLGPEDEDDPETARPGEWEKG